MKEPKLAMATEARRGMQRAQSQQGAAQLAERCRKLPARGKKQPAKGLANGVACGRHLEEIYKNMANSLDFVALLHSCALRMESRCSRPAAPAQALVACALPAGMQEMEMMENLNLYKLALTSLIMN